MSTQIPTLTDLVYSEGDRAEAMTHEELRIQFVDLAIKSEAMRRALLGMGFGMVSIPVGDGTIKAYDLLDSV